MPHNQKLLFACQHCDIWAPDAFGPASWSLPFGPEPVLKDFSWTWNEGEVWAVIGPNDREKEVLASALLGQCKVQGRGNDSAWINTFTENGRKGISFSLQDSEETLKLSQRFDESDLVDGGMHPGLTVERYLGTLLKSGESWNPLIEELWDSLGLELLREEGLKYLSTGELRKVLLFHALALNPSLLVFEDVLEGLDASTRKELVELFHRLAEADSRKETDISRMPSLLFLCDRMDQIPPCVTHLLQLNGGKALSITHLTSNEFLQGGSTSGVLEISSPKESSLESPLVRMRSVRVAYQDKVVFEGFNFDLYPGEHCLVQGPNGCGKSTLVKLITGEHPQAWMNDITVANIHRGTGESVKEVSMQTSLVSQSLHHAFLQLEDIEMLEVVLSGFFGTIGLYEPAGEEKVQEAREALELCGLNGQENRLFKDLPWGIQRLVLAARAFVRRPPLMILDEPCTGLDDDHRRILLETLDKIGEEQSTTILLVTHDPAERLSCLRAELVFHPNGSAGKGHPRYYPEFHRL